MVDRIGDGTNLARAAIEAALKRQADAMRRMGDTASETPGAPEAAAKSGGGFLQGLRDAKESMQKSDQLVDDLITGKIQDFSEAAVQIKQTDLAFRYTLEVRNKFIDAYREVMRMSV